MSRVVLVEEVLRDWARCCRATLNRRIDAGQFPRPIYVGKRCAWTVETLEHWIATRESTRRCPVGLERRKP